MEPKQKILIVDDSEINRAMLKEILGEGYEYLEAENGLRAIEILRRRTDIALVLLDLIMPEMDGFDVLRVMQCYAWQEEIPVIVISAAEDTRSVERAYDMGVADYIRRPFERVMVLRRVKNALMLYAKQKRLTRLVTDQVYEKEHNGVLMISILSHVVEFRNSESGQHVLHIRTLTDLLLHQLVQKTDRYQLDESDISLISTASALHDIGKIMIPEEILNKPGRLTEEEYATIKTHTTEGARILKGLAIGQDEPLVKVAHAICRWHHERWDGGGYPDRLKGDEIPIAAQVVALADVYDALTSERCYKQSYSHEKAVDMILHGECGSFNPLLMECLKESSELLRTELQRSEYDRGFRHETRRLSEEILHREALPREDRAQRLLDLERERTAFYAEQRGGIQFDYDILSGSVTVVNRYEDPVNRTQKLDFDKGMGLTFLSGKDRRKLLLGAEVIYESMYDVHVSGHACQEEQKLMLTLTKPKFFLPVHGEYKQLKKHALTAASLGIPTSNILIAENGSNVILSQDEIKLGEPVTAGAVMVDGLGVGDVGNVVLRDRKHLSEDGLVIIVATVDSKTGKVLAGPDLVSRGFVYVRENESLMDGAQSIVENALDRCVDEHVRDWNSVKTRVREALSSYIYRRTKRSPMILPILMEV